MVNISDSKSMQPRVAGGSLGLLLIDLQERLAPAIADSRLVIDRAVTLVEAAGRAGLPVLATEQYSKGLGLTVSRLRGRLKPDCIIEKTAFAAPREADFRDALTEQGIGELVVAGTEAHVCVLQTVLCLLAQGWRVSLVSDAVASRQPVSKEIALRRMAAAGAVLTTTEEAAARLGARAEGKGVGHAP